MIALVILILAGVTIAICGTSIIAKIFALFFTLLAFIFFNGCGAINFCLCFNHAF
jgi:hypothetical protein